MIGFHRPFPFLLAMVLLPRCQAMRSRIPSGRIDGEVKVQLQSETRPHETRETAHAFIDTDNDILRGQEMVENPTLDGHEDHNHSGRTKFLVIFALCSLAGMGVMALVCC